MAEISQLGVFDSAASSDQQDRPTASGGQTRRPHPRQSATGPFTQTRPPFSPSLLVSEFHRAFGLVNTSGPTLGLPPELISLRLDLIEEETCELRQAISELNLVAIADALGDIVYVTFGAALTFGIDLDAVVAEIHRSNMTKLGADGKPVVRSDGKVLKGPHYSPPQLGPILGC